MKIHEVTSTEAGSIGNTEKAKHKSVRSENLEHGNDVVSQNVFSP